MKLRITQFAKTNHLKLTAKAPENRPFTPKRKQSYSNHPFSGRVSKSSEANLHDFWGFVASDLGDGCPPWKVFWQAGNRWWSMVNHYVVYHTKKYPRWVENTPNHIGSKQTVIFLGAARLSFVPNGCCLVPHPATRVKINGDPTPNMWFFWWSQ